MVRVTALMQADRTKAQIKALAVLIVYAFSVNWALKGTEPAQLKVLQRFRYRLWRKQAGSSQACRRNISSYGQTEGLPSGPGLDLSFTGVTQPSAQDHGPVFDRQTRSGPSDQRGADRAARGIRPARCSRREGRSRVSSLGLLQRPLRFVPCSDPFSEAEQPPDTSIGSGPGARDSSGGRLQRKARRSRGVCSGCRSITPRSRHSPHRVGFNVQQVLELAGSVVSRVQAVRDNRNTLVQKQPQSFGGQLGQSKVESSRRQILQFGGQGGHRPFEARIGSRHRSQVARRHGTEAEATIEAAVNRGMQSQTVASAQQRLKHCARKLTCDSRSRSPGPAVPVGTDQRDRPRARAEHQQGTARPAQRARRKPARSRPEARELPAPTGKN